MYGGNVVGRQLTGGVDLGNSNNVRHAKHRWPILRSKHSQFIKSVRTNVALATDANPADAAGKQFTMLQLDANTPALGGQAVVAITALTEA